jgi:hypothetical protein
MKIISDGTPYGTNVLLDDGTNLQDKIKNDSGITKIEINVTSTTHATALIEIVNVPFEIDVKKENVKLQLKELGFELEDLESKENPKIAPRLEHEQ